MSAAVSQPSASSRSSGRFEAFVDLIKRLLLDLELNVALFSEIMKDEEIPLRARLVAIGVLLYVRSPIDIIPDRFRALALIDDALVMVAGLSLILPMIPEARLAYYRQKYKAAAHLDDYEQVLVDFLGGLWERLVQFARQHRRKYRKHTPKEVVESAELQENLHDETMEKVADWTFDPVKLDQELKLLSAPEVVKLLASGIEEEQQAEDGDAAEPRFFSRLGQALSRGETSDGRPGQEE